MKKKSCLKTWILLPFFLFLIVASPKRTYATTAVYSSPGTDSWTAPAGVTSATVQAWGGGGAGGGGTTTTSSAGGGGGGGEFRQSTISVNPNSSYMVEVGAGGTGDVNTGNPGDYSAFAATVVVAVGGNGGNTAAEGAGTGGAGGTGGTGTTGYTGGNGYKGSSNGVGGGGGEGAGSTTNGTSATSQTGASGTDGGDGGNGGDANADGSPGSIPGGGGGGGGTRGGGAESGGDGASGRVILTWIQLPTISTQAVSDVLYTSASANGTIVSIGGGTVTRRGFCYMLGTSGNPTTSDTIIFQDGSYSAGSYILSMSGLSSGTAYRVRAYAVNADGTGYGDTIDLTTLNYSAPTLTTQAVTLTSYTSGTANGNITATGGSSPSIRGFAYKLGSSGDPTTADSVVYTEGSYGTGTYALSLTNLISGTGYRVRAYATNSYGTGYGDTVQLNTLNYSPTVTPNSPDNGSSSPSATPEFEFTGVDPESSPIRYNIQIDTSSGFDSIKGVSASSTYYFNDVTPLLSPFSGWENSGSAFDGSLSTYAGLNDTTPSSGYVHGIGTNAPSEVSSIFQVRARTYGAVNDPSGGVWGVQGIYTSGTAQALGTLLVELTSAGWTNYVTLSAPSGGWTWSSVQNLETRFNMDWDMLVVAFEASFYRTELEVTDGTTDSPLLNKISGTDAGFAGSPDNAGPFTSGQLVRHTVQQGNSLNPGTYYWRVRGIDPDGSNTYGDWSSTRTFVVTESEPPPPAGENPLYFDGLLLNQFNIY